MVISTYMSSTCGAQIFEAVGLNRELIDKYFRGTASNVGRSGYLRSDARIPSAHASRRFLGCPGACRHARGRRRVPVARARRGHMRTLDAIAKLQHSARANSYQTYKEYARLINDQSRRHMTLRGLFELKLDAKKAYRARRGRAGEGDRQAICHRCDVAGIDFDRGAFDACSCDEPIGGKSNTGEGGEDERRLPARVARHPDSHRRHARQRARHRPRCR